MKNFLQKLGSFIPFALLSHIEFKLEILRHFSTKVAHKFKELLPSIDIFFIQSVFDHGVNKLRMLWIEVRNLISRHFQNRKTFDQVVESWKDHVDLLWISFLPYHLKLFNEAFYNYGNWWLSLFLFFWFFMLKFIRELLVEIGSSFKNDPDCLNSLERRCFMFSDNLKQV